MVSTEAWVAQAVADQNLSEDLVQRKVPPNMGGFTAAWCIPRAHQN